MGYLVLAFLATLCFLASFQAGERVLWFGLAAFNLSAWMSFKGYLLLSFVVFASQILLMLLFTMWLSARPIHPISKPFRYFKPAFTLSCILMALHFLVSPPLHSGNRWVEATGVYAVVLFLLGLGCGSVVLMNGVNLFSEKEPS
jgi:hypothetical protein